MDFQALTSDIARGYNFNFPMLNTLNSRVLSSTVPFTIPDLENKDLTKESVFVPILVSTNIRKLSLNNSAAASISQVSGNPLYACYARMQRSILPDPALFRRLCFYPEKVLRTFKILIDQRVQPEHILVRDCY